MLEYDLISIKENPFFNVYEIKKGDTLYEISKKYNVNTNLLAQLNGLNLNDYIYPGQIIYIPKNNVSYYITKEGDTLNNVSEIFNVTISDLVSQNEILYLLPEQMIFYKRT